MGQAKAKTFIGSSVEGLPVAKALRQCWHHSSLIEADIWCDAGFRLSKTTIEGLEEVLDRYDYGVFVFTADDRLTIRGQDTVVVRDNVLFELGLFLGRHGRERCYIVVPRDSAPRLPTDLRAITMADYVVPADPSDAHAWVGKLRPAAEQVEVSVAKLSRRTHPWAVTMFNQLDAEFHRLLAHAQTVTTFFIHSRRWRENNLDEISEFLRRPESRWSVFLPDPRNTALIASLCGHFDDGPVLGTLIDDAHRYFAELHLAYPDKVSLYCYALYPTYSAYQFDDVAVFALYPTTTKRKHVPAFRATDGSPEWGFWQHDLSELRRTSRKRSERESRVLVQVGGELNALAARLRSVFTGKEITQIIVSDWAADGRSADGIVHDVSNSFTRDVLRRDTLLAFELSGDCSISVDWSPTTRIVEGAHTDSVGNLVLALRFANQHELVFVDPERQARVVFDEAV